MTARINTTVYNVAVTFDGSDGTAGRADIVETSPPRASVRTVELFLTRLPEPLAAKAREALASGSAVEVRVLEFFGSWIVVEARADEELRATLYRLESRGPIMAGSLPVA